MVEAKRVAVGRDIVLSNETKEPWGQRDEIYKICDKSTVQHGAIHENKSYVKSHGFNSLRMRWMTSFRCVSCRSAQGSRYERLKSNIANIQNGYTM